jgi:translocation protein SEC63
MGVFGKAFAHELPKPTGHEKELDALEGMVRKKLGDKWESLTQVVDFKDARGRRAVVLLYAHLLRLPVEHASLIKGRWFYFF